MEPISDTDLATLPVYTYEEVAKQQLESAAQVRLPKFCLLVSF